jgi:ABC-2 type transport system ATP-binding protein
MADVAPALRLLGASKRYAGELALDRTELEIQGPGVIGLLCPNGGGKSTLLGLCAGALRPTSGRVEALGFDPALATPLERGRIGYVGQDVALDPEMTGRETFELLAALNRLSKAERARDLAWLHDALGLGAVLERRVATYSGGMRRRLHLGLSLTPRAQLLLLDEPFVGLDAETRALVWASLGERARGGATVVIATHDLFDAGQNCQMVAVLRDGRVLAFASPAQLIARHTPSAAIRPSLESALLQLLREAA